MPDSYQHTIIIFDNDESRRSRRSRTLHQAGYRTLENIDRKRVGEALRDEIPALVVVAVNSSNTEDLELCRQIKANVATAQTKILQVWPTDVCGAVPMAPMETGADAYIIEPSEAQEFLAMAQVLLRLHDRESENRRLCAQLRANQDEFHAWFENTSIGMCQCDPFTGKFLRVNRRFCELLDYCEAELVGQLFSEFIHPEDRDMDYRGFIRLVREESREYQVIKRQIKRDGSLVWTDVTMRLLRDDSGKPLVTLAMALDITARKRHEAGRALLLDVTRSIVENRKDSAALAATIFEQIRDYLNVDVFFNYQLDSELRLLRLINRSGIPPQWFDACQQVPAGQPFYGLVAAPVPVIVDSRLIAADARAALLRGMSVRAFACHPLTARNGEVLGTLSFGSTQRDRFDADEVALMAEISHVLALAWERKRAEEIAQRWQRLFEQSHFGLAHEDARSDSFVAVNRAFAEHRGYTVDELIGQPSLTIYPTDLRDSVTETVRAADEKGHALFETLHQRKNGEIFPVLVEITTVKDLAGMPLSRMAYALDISRLKSAEAALRQSEEQFRGFFENVAVGTALCDPETGHFRKVNETFCRMVGYSADELAALTPYDLTSPADRAYQLEVASRWHRGESQSFQIEKRFSCKDGSPLWVRVNANMVRDGAGRPVMGVGIISDISERKRIQFNAEFLLKLGRELGRLTDADDIGNTAVCSMAQYLGVPACGLLSIDAANRAAELNYQWCSGQRNFAATYRINDFAGQALLDVWRRGETVAINDVAGDPLTQPFSANFAAQNTQSFAAAPLLSEGVFEVILVVSAAGAAPLAD